MDKSELFLKKYKELEAAIRAEYPGARDDERSPVLILSRSPEFRSSRPMLDLCRDLRNLLTHNTTVDGRYGVYPDDALLSFLDRMIGAVKSPAAARDICVPRERILCVGLDGLVMPVLRKMRELFYSHVPIVENGIVTGVFSENSVLTCLVDGIAPFGEDVTFRDIEKYLAFDVSRAESYRFVSGYERVSSIIDTFESATEKKDRVGMIFVTKNGMRDGELEGIITAWDVASRADQ
ncbi:MAG: CBS domain-containing protein [Clostridia bacterium]|nr:CBS domain-containing protein [Clostridia bacterium]